jgi:hypothetical protein
MASVISAKDRAIAARSLVLFAGRAAEAAFGWPGRRRGMGYIVMNRYWGMSLLGLGIGI